MKYLILKTVNANGKAYGGFIWPTEGSVEAPDWTPTPKCGGGLHGLLDGRGEPGLLCWNPMARWILFEADKIVDLSGKVKAPKGNVVYYGDRDGAIQILADRAGLFVREWICQDPEWAYMYAHYVDDGPREDTRAAVCRDPKWAYWYALKVDKCPRDDTREAACEYPRLACYYAFNVDKCSRDDTRTAACKDPEWAYRYAFIVDGKKPREDTWPSRRLTGMLAW